MYCINKMTNTGKTHFPETSTKKNMKIASTTFRDCSPVMYQQHEKNQVVQELEGDIYLTRYALGKWLPTLSFNHYVQLSILLSILCEKIQDMILCCFQIPAGTGFETTISKQEYQESSSLHCELCIYTSFQWILKCLMPWHWPLAGAFSWKLVSGSHWYMPLVWEISKHLQYIKSHIYT